MSARARRASTRTERVIGGARVRQRVRPGMLPQGFGEVFGFVVSEVIEQSASLSLDDERDQATLVKRISYALGLDS